MTPIMKREELVRWVMWHCSLAEPPDIVEDVADNKEEPARDRQVHGHHFACRIVLWVQRVLPEKPVSREERQPDRRDMLLEIEEALRFPIAGLFDRDTDVDAILGVDVRAHDECEDPQNANRRSVTGCGHRTEARHEPPRSGDLTHGHHGGDRLVRQRSQQGNRQQEMKQLPYRPKRIDGNDIQGCPPFQLSWRPRGQLRAESLYFLRCADLIAPASIGKLPDSSCYDLGDPVVVSYTRAPSGRTRSHSLGDGVVIGASATRR